MYKKFKFDYDAENDSLFIFDPKTKSNSSIELDDLVIDFNSKKQVSAIEFLNASAFFKGLVGEPAKTFLRQLQDCKIDIMPKKNFLLIKLLLLFKKEKKIETPIMVPTIKKQSPALKY